MGTCVLHTRTESGICVHWWQRGAAHRLFGDSGLGLSLAEAQQMLFKDARAELVRCAKATHRCT